MSGWTDWIFGNLPPPARPSSRGALLGARYQNMPDMTAGIEDRRGGPDASPSTSLSPEAALNSQILSKYPPGSRVYNLDQWNWLQKNMPGDLPTTPLPDPDFSLDPSIMARVKAAQNWAPGQEDWISGPTVNPSPGNLPPDTPRRGPQFSPDQLYGALRAWGGWQ